jgi:hypothetical protein
MSEKVIQYHGFHASEFTRAYMSERLDEIFDSAPYGANMKAVFTRKGRLFKGVITIYSSAGRFFAAASGRKVRDVAHRLTSRIRKQLDKWKSSRFENESIKEENYDDNFVA